MANDEKKAGGDAADIIQSYFTDLAQAAFETQATFVLKIYGVAAQTARDMRARQDSIEESDAALKARGAARLAETRAGEEKQARRDWRREFDRLKDKGREAGDDRGAEERELAKIDEVVEDAERAGKLPPVDQIEGAAIEDGETVGGQTKLRITNSPPRRVCLFDFRKFKPPAKSELADAVRDAARKLSRGRSLAGPHDVAAADEAIARLYDEFPWFQAVLSDLMAQLRASAENGDGAAFRPMLLVGPPGVGKTRFASKLASALGLHFERHDCAAQDDVRALAGTARGWSSAEFAAPVRALLACDHANPMLFLDEIEKGGARWRHYTPASLVLPWLEQSSNATWRDPLLMAPVDVSRLLWVFGANDLKGLPAPFLSRVSVYEIPAPGAEHFDPLFASIVFDLEEEDRKHTGPAWSIVTPRSGVDEFDEPERDLIEPEAVAYLRERFTRERLSPRELARLVKRAADATPRKRGVAQAH